MNLEHKTDGMPKVYLLNLKEREDRLEIMKTQFEKYKINYEVFNASKYTPRNLSEWESKVTHGFDARKCPAYITIYMAMVLSWFEIIEDWLNNTNDPYMIFMEDDCVLETIDHWHFDWNYLMNNIPYDWDLIQFSFENDRIYPCYLHPTLATSGMGCWMINRPYAHKLLRLHKKENKLNISRKDYAMSSSFMDSYNCSGGLEKFPFLQLDYIIMKNGRNYTLPLFYMSPDLGRSHIKTSKQHPIFELTKEACLLWWTEKRDEYSLEDFFTYGKSNDLVFKFREGKIINK